MSEKSIYEIKYEDNELMGISVHGTVIVFDAKMNHPRDTRLSLSVFTEQHGGLSKTENARLGIFEESKFFDKINFKDLSVPVDTTFVHPCTEKCGDPDAFQAHADSLCEMWKNKQATSIVWLTSRLYNRYLMDTCDLGSALLTARYEILSRNREINKLRIENAELHKKLTDQSSERV